MDAEPKKPDYITVEVSGVTEEDILYGIAALAGFPKNSAFKQTGSFWPEINGRHTFLAWHGNLVDSLSCGEFMLMPPDIAVSQIYEFRPEKGDWRPTDKYRVSTSERVNPELFGHLEERIREEYQKVA